MQQISTVQREFQAVSLKKVFVQEKLGHFQQILQFLPCRRIILFKNKLWKTEQPVFIGFPCLRTDGTSGFRRHIFQIFGGSGGRTFAQVQRDSEKIKKIKLKISIMCYPIIFKYQIKKTVDIVKKTFKRHLFGHTDITQTA